MPLQFRVSGGTNKELLKSLAESVLLGGRDPTGRALTTSLAEREGRTSEEKQDIALKEQFGERQGMLLKRREGDDLPILSNCLLAAPFRIFFPSYLHTRHCLLRLPFS